MGTGWNHDHMATPRRRETPPAPLVGAGDLLVLLLVVAGIWGVYLLCG